VNLRSLRSHLEQRRFGWRLLAVPVVARSRARDAWRARTVRAGDRRLLARIVAPLDPVQLAFPEVRSPEVSVIIPVFNQWALTRACLASIIASAPLDRLEVIVVDDASTDETARELPRVANLRTVTSATNAGFTHSVNRGAQAARGRYLLFLNNDTRVYPGWLEGLVDAVGDTNVAAAGSKLVYPTGLLQEAGGVIWNDGSGWNLGRGRSPRLPQYNYRRDVDYCSAASLLVRTDVFTQAGGFDERFAPAYYEDTDLCFTLRDMGYRVVYEPSSVVVHLEGATHGTDRRHPASGAHGKANQHRNRAVFAAKWAGELAGRLAPPARVATLPELSGSRQDPRPRVLVYDVRIPTPDQDSGSQRMAWLLRLLAPMSAHLTLVPHDRIDREPYAAALRRDGIEVIDGGLRSFSAFGRERGDFYDLVVLCRPEVASAHLGAVRRHFPRAKVVFDTTDLKFVREQRRSALTSTPRDDRSGQVRQLELGLVRRCDVTATVTETERDTVRRYLPDRNVIVLPNVHERRRDRPPPFEARSGLLFIGSFRHDPNPDAVAFFLDEILPLVRRRIDARFVVIGGSPPDDLIRRRGEGVRFAGHVDDVLPLFDASRVFVSPLRYGAGMKGKNGQAMALGLPMVTSHIGAEGMDLVDGVHALVRDDPASFADAVVRLHEDPILWGEVAENARRAAEERWSPEMMRSRLRQLAGVDGR
jgi:GT2 family glycosyltransferase/glycosyltransferase involved in cell wall biosynthesis